jgi:hypothetical protein
MENTQTMEPLHQRDKQQALDELSRELNVRKRCFPRWVVDGRVSATDAQDRIDRLATAIQLLNDQSSEVAKVRKLS